MSLFHCSWPDRASMLVDATDEADARAMASDLSDGEAPARVVAFPVRAFVAEIVEEEDDIGATFLSLDPVEHTATALESLEDSAPSSETSKVRNVCAQQAEIEDGSIVTCNLLVDHGGNHAAGIGDDRVVW